MISRQSINLALNSKEAARLAILVFGCYSVSSVTHIDAQISIYTGILEQQGMKVDSNSLSTHFTRFTPSPDRNARIQSLIQQLGDDKYLVRVSATKELLKLKQTSAIELRKATSHVDPEIRKRARKVVAAAEKKPNALDLLYALLQVVSAKKSSCTVQEISGVLPICTEPYLEAAAQRALLAVASRKDTDQLRSLLYDKHFRVRVAAIHTLAKVIGKESAIDLYPILRDSNAQVKLAACEAIANFGDRKCLLPLAELLNGQDLAVFNSARMVLRQLSGLHFDKDTTDKINVEVVAAKWKTWVNGEGQTSKLRFPLQAAQTVRGDLGGNTLLAYGHNSKVELLDPTLKKKLWAYNGDGALSAEKLTNGNVLIAEFKGNRVTEVNLEGEVVWQFKVPKPLNAEPLSNGNVLIAQYGDDTQAIEVNRQGQIVWKHSVPTHCRTVHRLENGNTLMTGGFTVYIITPSGSVVWKYDTEDVCDCKPMINGNIVISTRRGRTIFQVNPENNEVVWTYDHLDEVADVYPIANGNLLVTGRSTFAEVTPEKKVLWKKTGCYFGSIRK